MSVSQTISELIPRLRRFARALSGSQAAGDAYVVATLEGIIAAPSTLPAGPDIRIRLFRLFLEVWASTPLNLYVDRSGVAANERSAHQNLEAVSLRPRIAFLLNALEGFDMDEVGLALGASREQAMAMINRASREIADQIRTNVLIIEDEPLIALELQTLVEDLGHRVLDIARTHDEAIQAVQRARPGLILADIQLLDGSSGLEAVNQILDTTSIPVIFVTAYPEQFLKGVPPEPAFLITKPFSVEMLNAIISQALFFERKAHRAAAPAPRQPQGHAQVQRSDL
jgi:CheY-like chemotaxis protein